MSSLRCTTYNDTCQLYLDKTEGRKKEIPGKEKVSFVKGFFPPGIGWWWKERGKQAS